MAKQTVSIDETVRAGTIKLTLHKEYSHNNVDRIFSYFQFQIFMFHDYKRKKFLHYGVLHFIKVPFLFI